MTGPIRGGGPPWRPSTARRNQAKGGNVLTRCPRCGRRTNADMLLELTPAAQQLLGVAHAHVCDGCREQLFRRGLDQEAFYAALGAPAAALQEIRNHVARLRGG